MRMLLILLLVCLATVNAHAQGLTGLWTADPTRVTIERQSPPPSPENVYFRISGDTLFYESFGRYAPERHSGHLGQSDDVTGGQRVRNELHGSTLTQTVFDTRTPNLSSTVEWTVAPDGQHLTCVQTQDQGSYHLKVTEFLVRAPLQRCGTCGKTAFAACVATWRARTRELTVYCLPTAPSSVDAAFAQKSSAVAQMTLTFNDNEYTLEHVSSVHFTGCGMNVTQPGPLPDNSGFRFHVAVGPDGQPAAIQYAFHATQTCAANCLTEVRPQP